MGYAELLKRAELGEITDPEIQAVADELASSVTLADRFTLLQILGESRAKSTRPLVEHYLDCPEDPMLSRLALEILCLYWGETSRYVEHLRRFIEGISWDSESVVRQVAILLAGSYLRSNSDTELLCSIIGIAENTAENTVIRGDAYLSLGRALGKDWRNLPSATRQFDIDQLNSGLLDEAKERVRNEGRRDR